MSTSFESSIKQIPYPQQQVYDILSNLENLEKVRDRVPKDKVGELEFTRDSLALHVAPVGKISLHVVERKQPDCIKFETTQSPVPFHFWIQLLPVTESSCKMRLTLKADLNPFIRGMVSKPLQEGIEKVAETLAAVKYDQQV